MTRYQRIKDKFKQLGLECVELTDVSMEHANHAHKISDTKSTETHFIATIKINQNIKDISIINRHRLINEALKEEFLAGMHSLSLKFKD